jgi:hypothetical protein
LEAACDSLFAYDPAVVHGLVQAEEYTECAVLADGETDPREIRRRLDERIARKLDAFGRRGKRVTVVLGAAALEPGLAPPDVTSRQYRYLRAMAVPGDVDIRVLRHDVPWPAFTLLTTGDSTVAYLEGAGDAEYLEGEAAEPYRSHAAALRRASVPIRQVDAGARVPLLRADRPGPE